MTVALKSQTRLNQLSREGCDSTCEKKITSSGVSSAPTSRFAGQSTLFQYCSRGVASRASQTRSALRRRVPQSCDPFSIAARHDGLLLTVDDGYAKHRTIAGL
jgi:hypothetical protein